AALGTTPARLMDGRSPKAANDEDFGEDLDLLTEIIARLQEIVAEHRRKLPPQDFAAITAAIYRRMRADRPGAARGAIGPRIHDLLGYEMLRQRKRR
ncbi:MAG TPA: hypothetical protein VMV79_06145, partial [Alphaproteobacteria bacterium]|nr:hypothetical protein [Alphaproteobacteria bacterium]